MAAAFIAVGYGLLVAEFGWPGLAAAVVHAAVLLAGLWRRK